MNYHSSREGIHGMGDGCEELSQKLTGSMNTDWKDRLEKVLDREFPKGKCKERGAALMLFAEAVNLLTTQRAEAYEEGQKHAFGVDREHVKQEVRNELRAELAGHPAVIDLRENQVQADEEGICVIVSRQALDEVLALLTDKQ